MTKKQYTGMNTAVALGIFVATNRESVENRTLGQVRVIVQKGLGPEVKFSDGYLRAALKEADIPVVRSDPNKPKRVRGTSNSSRVIVRCVLELFEVVEQQTGMEPGQLLNTKAGKALVMFRRGDSAGAVELICQAEEEDQNMDKTE